MAGSIERKFTYYNGLIGEFLGKHSLFLPAITRTKTRRPPTNRRRSGYSNTAAAAAAAMRQTQGYNRANKPHCAEDLRRRKKEKTRTESRPQRSLFFLLRDQKMLGKKKTCSPSTYMMMMLCVCFAFRVSSFWKSDSFLKVFFLVSYCPSVNFKQR